MRVGCVLALLLAVQCVVSDVSPTLYTVSLLTDVMVDGVVAPPVVINITRYFAPHSADRFLQLVKAGYFTSSGFYSVVTNHSVQFGVASTPEVTAMWSTPIPDETLLASNGLGTIAFVSNRSQPNSRTTHLVISLSENSRSFDQLGLVPFGEVVSGLDSLRHVHDPGSVSPELYATEGQAWFLRSYPSANLITNATITYASIPLGIDEQSLVIEENDGVPMWTLCVAFVGGVLVTVFTVALVFCSKTIMRWLVSLLSCCGCSRLSLTTWLKWYLAIREDDVEEVHDPLSLDKEVAGDMQRLDETVLDAQQREFGSSHLESSAQYNPHQDEWDGTHHQGTRLEDIMSYNTRAPSYAKPHPAYAAQMVPWGGNSGRKRPEHYPYGTAGTPTWSGRQTTSRKKSGDDNPIKDAFDAPPEQGAPPEPGAMALQSPRDTEKE